MKKSEIDCNQFQTFSWWRQSAGCEIHQMNEYSLFDGKEVITCPAGNKPIKNTYNPITGQCRVVMESNACNGCSNRDKFKAKLQKRSAIVNVSEKMVQRAKQMAPRSH